MNKRTVPVLAVLAIAILLMAACLPPSSAPAAQPTVAPVLAPTTAPAAAVQPTVEAPAPTADTQSVVPAPPADNSRPLAKLSPQERQDRFSGPATNAIKSDTIYIATFVTDKGNIVAELYQDTPQSANNFVTLAQDGFYDGLTFHRVEPGFVIQGGDPAGDGSGGPGYTIPAEIKHLHNKGALAWARTSDQVNPERRSSGSQFYITLDQTPFLNDGYTVFGNVIEGMDVAAKIAVGDKIQRIDISEAATSRMPAAEPTYTPAPTPTPEPTATVGPTPTPYAPTAKDGRPLAQLPVEKREKVYNTAPAMTIDATKSYQATFDTVKGKIVVELDTKTAPLTVNNFVLLANLGFYDGMPVAHVQPATFLISGSPAKRPDSDIGYTLALEPTANASQVVTGTISMWPLPDATGAPTASGSQFFISFVAIPENTTPLNIFGKVSEGMDVVMKLAIDDIINKVTITEK